MNKNKLTLIIDGNWLLMSRMSVIWSKGDPSSFSSELKNLMMKSISIVLRQFPMIDNIIFVSDGGSWRNSVEIPAFISDEYKGNREKSDEIDWELVFNAYEDFQNILKESNINVFHEFGVEGDDWCYFLTTYLNSQGINTLIWSRDKDLTQLVSIDKNSCFTACWSKEAGLIIADSDDEDMNFFFNNNFSENENILNALIHKAKQITKINPQEIVIDKVIRGDAGDNILPIILKKTKPESTREYRVSLKDIDMNMNIHDDEIIKKWINDIYESKTYKDKICNNKTKEQIFEHFKYNIKLVELAESSYPQEILDKFELAKDNISIFADLSEAESKLAAKTNKIEDFLENI